VWRPFYTLEIGRVDLSTAVVFGAMSDEENKCSMMNNELVDDGSNRNRKHQFRFSAEMDHLLAQEVLAYNPFEAEFGAVGMTWERIAEALGASVDGRRCRERLKLLVKNRKRCVAQLLAASGIEETVSELDHLMDEIISVQEASVAVVAERKKERSDAADKSEQAGEELRQRAMEGMTPRKKKRPVDEHALPTFIQTRHSTESETKRQKPELESRRIELEERRLALAEKRAELEKQERVAIISLLAGMAAKLSDTK